VINLITRTKRKSRKGKECEVLQNMHIEEPIAHVVEYGPSRGRAAGEEEGEPDAV